MEINFKVSGERRKQLVETIGKITGNKPVYQGLPTYAFKVGDLVVGKTGWLTLPSSVDRALLDHLMARLLEMGFAVDNPDTLAIELPKEGMSETAIANLEKLVKSKESLIKKALGVASLPIEVTEDKIRFPWFPASLTPKEIHAYSHFISALAALARKQKRVLIKADPGGSEKYAFRVFLLRLGFIGDEFKSERKILLAKLSGSSSYATFRNGSSKD